MCFGRISRYFQTIFFVESWRYFRTLVNCALFFFFFSTQNGYIFLISSQLVCVLEGLGLIFQIQRWCEKLDLKRRDQHQALESGSQLVAILFSFTSKAYNKVLKKVAGKKASTLFYQRRALTDSSLSIVNTLVVVKIDMVFCHTNNYGNHKITSWPLLQLPLQVSTIICIMLFNFLTLHIILKPICPNNLVKISNFQRVGKILLSIIYR